MIGRSASPKRRIEEREQVLAVLLAREVLLVELHLELDLRHPTSAQRTTESGCVDRKRRKNARQLETKREKKKQTHFLSRQYTAPFLLLAFALPSFLLILPLLLRPRALFLLPLPPLPLA